MKKLENNFLFFIKTVDDCGKNCKFGEFWSIDENFDILEDFKYESAFNRIKKKSGELKDRNSKELYHLEGF